MNHREPNQSDPHGNFDPFIEGIRHAENGYKNAQDIIKFVDTKAGVIAGFAFVGIGVILQGIKEFLVSSKETQASIVTVFQLHPRCAIGIFLFSALSSAFGVFCVWFAVQCVIARPPRIASKLKHTILFPFYNADKEYGFAREHFEKLERGLNYKEIAEEYGSQLLNVGAILHKKIKYQRRAVNAFLVQLLLLTLTGTVIFGCSYCFTSPPSAAPVPVVAGSNLNTPSPQPVHAPSSPIPSSKQ